MKKVDEEFVCINCNKFVGKLGYTSRDHCPNCLYGLHVDIKPGDRLNECRGILKPIGIKKYKESYKIIYRCLKCGEILNNIMATDDNFDKLIEASKGVI